MCSIIGFYKLSDTAVVKSKFLKDGLDLMRHRGPDAEAVKYFDNRKIGLGNQRLSIVDVKTGANQPMETGKSALVYNGEIYNYVELKNKLKKKRVKFDSESDTEVLLKGLEKDGVNFLNSTNGMYAFAHYFFKDQSLILGRDRFGVKPVYYLIENEVLYFSSELKPLLKIKKEKKRNINYYEKFFEDTATDYDETTFIEGIYQVKPGHVLVVKDIRISQRKWYFGRDFKVNTNVFNSPKKTVEYIEDILVDALRIRIRADVPASISLSGGLDSSVLYVLAKERLNANLASFSLFDSAPELSEKDKILKLVQSYDDKVTSFGYSKHTIIGDLKECLYSTEFPIWDPSVVVYDELYKRIHQAGFKMVVEGHGSDEALGGYSYMVEEAVKEQLSEGKYFSSLELLDGYLKMNVYSGKENLVKKFAYLFLQSRNKKNIIGFEKILDEAFNYKILPIVLRTFDRLSMVNSIESRAPFMDYRVVETFKKLPMRYKIDKIGSKAILRLILKKYEKDFIYKDKRKIGFGIKVEELVNNSKPMKLFFRENINKFNIFEFGEMKKKALWIMEKEKIEAGEVNMLWKIAAVGFVDNQLFS